MLVTFYRAIIKEANKEPRVVATISGMQDGVVWDLGKLNFPDKKTWTQFFKATQKGALQVRDLDVRLEATRGDEGDSDA